MLGPRPISVTSAMKTPVGSCCRVLLLPVGAAHRAPIEKNLELFNALNELKECAGEQDRGGHEQGVCFLPGKTGPCSTG